MSVDSPELAVLIVGEVGGSARSQRRSSYFLLKLAGSKFGLFLVSRARRAQPGSLGGA